MRPADIQQIGQELAIKWDDGTESYVSLEQMRRDCPCAGCKGETDILGNKYGGKGAVLSPQSFHLTRLDNVGGYALRPVWGDGHASGLFPYEYLRRAGGA
jgi:DUF971 family protein